MKQHTSDLSFYKFKNISLHGTTSKYRFLFTFTMSTATLQLLAIWDGVISLACNNRVTIEQHTLTSCKQLLLTRIKSKLLQLEPHLLMLIFVQKLILGKNRAFSSLLWRSFSVPKHITTIWLCSTGFLQKIDKLNIKY